VTETALVDPPPHEVRLRIRTQTKHLFPHARSTAFATFLGPALGGAVGTTVGRVTGDPRLAVAVAVVVPIVVFLRAWAWLRDPVRRAGWEVANDHGLREQREWKRDYGGSVPYGLSQQRKWITEHPHAPGTTGVLIMMGLLRDADAAATMIQIHDEAEWFDVANLWATRQWAAGHPVDLDRLRGAWAALQDPRTRRDKRECVAAIEALVEGEAGADAWAVFARARPEVGDVTRAARASTMVTLGALLTVVAVVVTGLLISAGL
jgi:hypothetical protein